MRSEASDGDPTRDLRAAENAHDRRTLLKKLGLGVAAAGVWVAPQVLGAPPASAGCTPVSRRLQIDPVTSTSVPPAGSTCLPSGWGAATTATISFTTSATNIEKGGTVTITQAFCTPTSAVAVRVCPGGSNPLTCVNGSIAGNVITFPTPSPASCSYTDIRIVTSCCT